MPAPCLSGDRAFHAHAACIRTDPFSRHPPARLSFLSLSSIATWIGLALASAALSAALHAASVPAAILIGPMVAAIGFGLAGSTRRVARPWQLAAQGVVGCLVASSISPAILAEIAKDWHAMLLGAGITVVASAAIGLFIARFGSLPGSTAAWGTAPGAASAMVLMGQEYGADPRLVATMQYVRLITVVLVTSLVSRMLMEGAPAPVAAPEPSRLASLEGTAICLLLAAVGTGIGLKVRIPAGGLIVPMALAAAINLSGVAHVVTPPWLLLVAYTAIGWAIGLQFERGSLVRSIRALPQMIASALAIVVLCGLGSILLMRLVGVSALTAFLATTPGGIDTVAILALSGGADIPFVMSLHVARLLLVIALGAPIARFIARRSRPD